MLEMGQDAVAPIGESIQFLNYNEIQGISGCGIWHIAEMNKKSLESVSIESCKLVAIEHSYDKVDGKVAGTWIATALKNIALAFPETKPAFDLVYPAPPAIWQP